MSASIKVLGRMGEYDVEFTFSIEDASEGAGIVAHCIENGLTPRPRFQSNAPKVELPFDGAIEKTEKMPAKDGKKEYNLAHVKAPSGELVPVKFWGPLRAWPVGMTVSVIKGQYGPMLEDKGDTEDIPF